jgi:hypothetical protein
MFRRANESLLFSVVHRVGAVSEVGATSETNLDENQFALVGHDQIDFAGADAVIAFDRSQAATREVCFSCALGAATPLGRRRLRAPR